MNDLYKKPLSMRLFAEFLGTIILTICVGFSLSATSSGITGLITGAVLLLTILAVVPISGGHLNPAVSIGLLLNMRIDARQTLSYVTTQFLGVFVGMGILFLLKVPWQTQIGEPVSTVLFEVLGALVFGIAFGLVMNSFVPDLINGPVIGIGLLLGIFIGSFSGTSFINPALAVVFAPYSYMLLIAPVIGFSLGFLLISLLNTKRGIKE